MLKNDWFHDYYDNKILYKSKQLMLLRQKLIIMTAIKIAKWTFKLRQY